MLNQSDILQTLAMIDHQHLDIRTITMGISLRDCAHPETEKCARNIYDKICRRAEKLVETGCAIEREYGIPIVNKRISVTPAALVAESCAGADLLPIARALDRAARECGVEPELLTLAYDVLARWSIEPECVGSVGRVLPKEYLYFGGNGEVNQFRTRYMGGEVWDWALQSPYQTEGAQ